MHSLFALAAPLALMLPWVTGADVGAGRAVPAPAPSAPHCDAVANQAKATSAINPLAALRGHATARQIRIEQRVVVRIAPQLPAARNNLLADLPPRQLARRFEERGKEKCVALQGIAGVQTGSGNRLVLFLRDSRMISVNLEKSCRARDFYSGFYVEKSQDGRLCIARDKLQSRTGARCEIEAMRQLVAVRD